MVASDRVQMEMVLERRDSEASNGTTWSLAAKSKQRKIWIVMSDTSGGELLGE